MNTAVIYVALIFSVIQLVCWFTYQIKQGRALSEDLNNLIFISNAASGFVIGALIGVLILQ